jgi:(p)ppGpp synthase/HD superfamily hydrolase
LNVERIDLNEVAALARRVHGAQRDPDGQLHVVHCERVVEGVEGETEQATALLHDVLEDTDETSQSLRNAGVPEVVVQAVEVLTRRPGERYAAYLARVADASGEAGDVARTVKVADLMDNLRRSRAMSLADRVSKYERALEYLRERGIGIGTVA